MMINCDICKGRKKILGLGNMQKDCPTCKGIGWLELPQDGFKAIKKDELVIPTKKIRKKKSESILQC